MDYHLTLPPQHAQVVWEGLKQLPAGAAFDTMTLVKQQFEAEEAKFKASQPVLPVPGTVLPFHNAPVAAAAAKAIDDPKP